MPERVCLIELLSSRAGGDVFAGAAKQFGMVEHYCADYERAYSSAEGIELAFVLIALGVAPEDVFASEPRAPGLENVVSARLRRRFPYSELPLIRSGTQSTSLYELAARLVPWRLDGDHGVGDRLMRHGARYHEAYSSDDLLPIVLLALGADARDVALASVSLEGEPSAHVQAAVDAKLRARFPLQSLLSRIGESAQ